MSPPDVRLELEALSHGEEASWRSFVDCAPGSTACHHPGWRRVLEDGMGHRTHYLLARDPDGAVRGVLPLARVRSRLFGDYLVSMPFLNDGGPLGDAEARTALAAAAVELARGARVDLLEFRGRQAVGSPLSEVTRKVTVLMELPDDPVTLWEKGLKSKLRSQVRRPMKEGMETRFGPDQLGPFYDVFARNMRDLGTPVLPRRFFEVARDALPEEIRFGTVYHRGAPVAAGCGFLWRGEFEMTWASSLRELNALAPNMLLYWSFMEQCIAEGTRVFNFGRCTPGEGTHRFKLQWGGHDLPLPWSVWSPGPVLTTPNPQGRKYRAAIRAWQHLPLAAANRLGPLLSRNIP